MCLSCSQPRLGQPSPPHHTHTPGYPRPAPHPAPPITLQSSSALPTWPSDLCPTCAAERCELRVAEALQSHTQALRPRLSLAAACSSSSARVHSRASPVGYGVPAGMRVRGCCALCCADQLPADLDTFRTSALVPFQAGAGMPSAALQDPSAPAPTLKLQAFFPSPADLFTPR